MRDICPGCTLGFHTPEFHLPRTETGPERESHMRALLKTYTTKDYIEEGYSEGLLFKTERDWLLEQIGEK